MIGRLRLVLSRAYPGNATGKCKITETRVRAGVTGSSSFLCKVVRLSDKFDVYPWDGKQLLSHSTQK